MFAHPKMLFLLLVLPPLLAVFFWWSWRKRQELMTKFIQSRLLPNLTVGISPLRQRIQMGCSMGAVVFIILALARPQWGFDWEEVKQRGLDIVVAIDTSKSMLATDVTPNRLARAKLAALDLMQQAKSDRLGLVAFAGSAFLQCPLTIDDSAFRRSVQDLSVNTIPEGGTAIAEAIETALTAFKEGDNHKVMVLMTDGEDHDSGIDAAVKKAQDMGMRIYTIGVGTPEGEILTIQNEQGHSDYIRDEQGHAVKSHLDEKLLRQIATDTGGFYLPMRGAKTIDTLYQHPNGLASLPKSDSAEKLVKRLHEHYHWPLAAAIVLLLVEMLLPESKRETKAATATRQSPKPAVAANAAFTILCCLPLAATGSSSFALREYNAGKYEQSLKDYQEMLKRKQDDPRLHFNAGAAAYRNRQYEEAVKQFGEALNTPDVNLQQQAYYNLGNALYYLGEGNPDPSKRSKTWEESMKDFQNTVKLNPQDGDAKFNYEFVKKRLEELKQQQQQQKQQNKGDQNQNQDQQQQNQDKKQDQQNKDDKSQQQNQSQQQQQQNSDKTQEAQKQEQQKQEQAQKDKEQQQQQAKSQEQKDKGQASQSSGQPNDKDQNQQAYALGQMTPQQAQQLLDAQKGQEMMLPIKPEGKPQDRSKPLKDW
jgi:Ca-activated chloride channel family protein